MDPPIQTPFDPENLRTSTFALAQYYFKSTLSKASDCKDPVDAIVSLNHQKSKAKSLISKAVNSVERRRRTKQGKYTFKMYATESVQVESIYWYKSHVKRINVKLAANFELLPRL
jgi:hypothetical protein